MPDSAQAGADRQPMPWEWWRPEFTLPGALATLAMELDNLADAIGPVPDLAERNLRHQAERLAEFAKTLEEGGRA